MAPPKEGSPQGEKESAILRASAEKEAAILKAEAEKQAAILKAEGEAEAMEKLQQAKAKSLGYLNEVGIKREVLQLRSYEALEAVANGSATKLIIPSNIQDMTTQYAMFNDVGLDRENQSQT